MKRIAPILLWMFALLAGCQSAPETAAPPAPTQPRPEAASAPKPSPAPSPTRQPPLTEREWTPHPILLRLDFLRPADGLLNPPAPPQFILYADGKAFITRPAIAGVPHGDQQILFKQMERAEICRVLNALDQNGFLDYDPSDYPSANGAQGVYDVYLEANAWKSRKGIYPGLPLRVFNELTGAADAPAVPPALRAAYALAADYPADGFEPYEAKEMGVWIRPLNPADFPNLQWENWTFPALTLSYMHSRIDYDGAGFDERYLILRKQGAANLYEYLREAFSVKYYVETDRLGAKTYYAAYARPLLPGEIPGGFEMETPTPAPESPKLKCLPSDGAMDIPQPNLIYAIPIP